VATTAFLAHRAGISVFATGGIGGVHRGELPDISADLTELAQTPIAVVCSGAKIVLDLPSTREWLETYGVTVVGYRTTEFPAFYSRTSGLPVDETVDNAIEAAEIISARDQLGLPNAILIGVPIPQEFEIERKLLETLLADALHAGSEKGIRGKEVTPFLLSELSARSGGTTLQANIALLENNARIAAEIACALAANR
jgi:pseudouridine-5'-phosphate glycosidase